MLAALSLHGETLVWYQILVATYKGLAECFPQIFVTLKLLISYSILLSLSNSGVL